LYGKHKDFVDELIQKKTQEAELELKSKIENATKSFEQYDAGVETLKASLGYEFKDVSMSLEEVLQSENQKLTEQFDPNVNI